MKSTIQITKLLCCAALLFTCTTATLAQLDHQMIFRVNSPGVIAGDYNYSGPALDAGNAATHWGPYSINTITGDLMWISDNIDSMGCQPGVSPLSGKIAMVRRATCNFSLKAYHAQALGAVGCVICNNVPAGGLVGMLGGDSMNAVNIPIVFLTYEDCALLAGQVDAGNTTSASFYVPTIYNAISSLARNTPVQHVQPLSGLQLTTYNTSTSAASNVVITADITAPGGAVTTLTETLGTLQGTTDSTVVFTGSYTPAAVGMYDVVFKTTLNTVDSVVHQFQVNADSTFALDNNDFTPSGYLGGIGPNDADYAAADPTTGATFYYEMGAVYTTGTGTLSDATSGTFALQNANTYVGQDFLMLVYEEPSGGFLGTEQNYSTFSLIGGGLYTVQPSDTLVANTLMNVPLIDISTGANLVTLQADKQYMLVLRHAGTGAILSSPKITYTHIEDFLSFAATTYVDRLYMAGWDPSYAPVIRMHVQNLLVGVDQTKSIAPSEVSIFPNPTNVHVNLKMNLEEVSEKVMVRLVDLTGKTLQEHKYQDVQNATYMYNVENLSAGVYLLHVQTDKGQTMQKVVVK